MKTSLLKCVHCDMSAPRQLLALFKPLHLVCTEVSRILSLDCGCRMAAAAPGIVFIFQSMDKAPEDRLVSMFDGWIGFRLCEA